MLKIITNPWLTEKRLELVDMPRFFSLKEYEETVSKVVAHLSRFQEVVAIHQIGSISAPGISDIDIVVVFADVSGRWKRAGYSRILNQRDRYRLMHSLFAISTNLYSRNDLLPPIFTSQLLHGTDVPANLVLSAQELSAVREIYAVEYVLANIFNLYQQVHAGRLKVRGLLCSFKALAHDLDLLSDERMRMEVREFQERVCRLRANWWNDPNGARQEMLEIPAQMIYLCQKVIASFAAMLSDTGEKAQMTGHLVCGPNYYVAPGNDGGLSVGVFDGRISQFFCENEGKWMVERLKPLIGFERAFWALKVNVPATIFALLHGEGGGAYKTSYAKRASFLKEYEDFMHCLPHEYQMLDILRWRPRENRKWHFIAGLNRLLWKQSGF